MMTRRSALLLLGTAAALPALLAAPRGAASTDLAARAGAFIEERGNQVIGIVNGNGGTDAKRDAVAKVLREAVDVQGVAQFVLGRHWRTASEAQRREYLSLFEETLVRNLSARFGELRGVTFNVGRKQMASETEAVVSTTVSRPNNPDVMLDWRVADVGGAPKIVDVVAEGSSLRITQRSEYAAVVQRGGGMDGLLRAMRQQLAQLESQERR
ncbi:MlaC/ttg2D family ABC transporter substrate-binding protein [Elioraea rosea]|uniref:MlaC/ttg2D family ABC transporter substrate-binding protein n=1 Tax=Elioraea rosea TaxID=2492390 RepID=UPI001EF732ED|nr:ABC transporter substrate-binding protein [Elioraea rosea]